MPDGSTIRTGSSQQSISPGGLRASPGSVTGSDHSPNFDRSFRLPLGTRCAHTHRPTITLSHPSSSVSRPSINLSSPPRPSRDYGPIIQGPDFFSIPASPPQSPSILGSQGSDGVISNPASMMHQANLPARGDYTHHVTLAVEPAPNHTGMPVPSSWTIRVVRFEGIKVEQSYKFDVHCFVVSKNKHPLDVLERILVLLGDIGNVAWRAMYGALRICISTGLGYEKYRTHCLIPLAWLFYKWACALRRHNSDPIIIAYYNRHIERWLLSASTVPELVREKTVLEFHQYLLSCP